jgi:hypothetical protein
MNAAAAGRARVFFLVWSFQVASSIAVAGRGDRFRIARSAGDEANGPEHFDLKAAGDGDDWCELLRAFGDVVAEFHFVTLNKIRRPGTSPVSFWELKADGLAATP